MSRKRTKDGPDYTIPYSTNLFLPDTINECVISSELVETTPLSSIKSGQPISFEIPESSDLFLDPNVNMKVTFKITNTDGSSIGSDTPVAPVNNAVHSLWKNVEVQLNDRDLSSSAGNYSYLSYFKNQFVMEAKVKETILEAQIWSEDTAGEFDSVDPSTNAGFKYRMALVNNSVLVTGYGRVYSDLFSQNRLIPPGFRLSLKFFPNASTFAVMSGVITADEIVTITDMSIFYRKVKLQSALKTALSSGLEIKPAVYPIKRHTLTVFQVPSGTTLVNRNIASFSQIPQTIVLGCVSADAFNGNYVKNPFNFVSKKCSNASVYIDGTRYPTNGFMPSYDARDKHLAYESMCKFAAWMGVKSNNISYAEYMLDGSCVYFFNINEPRLGTTNLVKNGSVSFKLEFPTGQVDEAICILVFQIFSNNIYLHGNRSCELDWM